MPAFGSTFMSANPRPTAERRLQAADGEVDENDVEEILIPLGSRSGSFFALALFGLCFAALGLVVFHELRKRMLSTRSSLLAALILFLGPVAGIYTSSLAGFYGLRIQERQVQLEGLTTLNDVSIPLDKIAHIQAQPCFKMRWQLDLRIMGGKAYHSTPARRENVLEAMRQLNKRLKPAAAGR